MRRLLVLLTVLLASGAVSAWAASPGFKTGRYTGTSSQQHKLTVRLLYTKQCGGPLVRRLCMQQVGRFWISARCADGTAEMVSTEETFAAVVGRSSRLSGTDPLLNVSWKLTISHRGSIKGSLSYSGGKLTNESVTCHSGKVTFSLKHV